MQHLQPTPPGGANKDITALIRKHKPVATPDLLSTAIKVCEHALRQAEAENWRDLYGLPEDYQDWRHAVEDLRGSLGEVRHA